MDLGGDFSSWLQSSGPRNRHQMGDISVMDAARRLVGAGGSPSRRNRHSADAPIKTEEGKPRRLSASVSLQNISPRSSFNFQDVLLFFRPPATMLVRGHGDCFKAESRRRDGTASSLLRPLDSSQTDAAEEAESSSDACVLKAF